MTEREAGFELVDDSGCREEVAKYGRLLLRWERDSNGVTVGEGGAPKG